LSPRSALFAILLCACSATSRPSHPEAEHTHVVADEPVPTEFVGNFGAWGDAFYVWTDDRYERVFLKGVDLGVGMPGTQPGDLAPRYDDYRRWFTQMAAAGVNVVRIYTLHFPRFYEALADHNTEHPDERLWVLHGAWLTANRSAPGSDLHDLTADFDGRIEEVVDACHGQLSVEHRFGQGWGEYERDISPWVLGYLIGREVYAEEVMATDDSHGRGLDYEGDVVRIADANASEIWAARRLEHTLEYESERYAQTHPVGFSSWMELDPLTHPTEPWYSGQDVASIDLAGFEVHGAPTGSFISYHCYPYFPHFVNDDPDYREVSDATGANPYLGVLRDLAAHYRGHPLIISEFGVPSSWGNAKPAFSGMDHGGHTEAAQARHIARMVDNIHSIGAAGAVHFHWMDGWYKQTWINEPRSFPRDRLRLWHDLTNPQQSYGLIAPDPAEPTVGFSPLSPGGTVHAPRSDRFQFRPVASDRSLWSPMRWNVRPGVDLPLGELIVRRASAPPSSQDAVVIDGSRVDVRIPWSLLHFSDPSAREVIFDDPDTAGLDARRSEGVRVAVQAGWDTLVSDRFRWETWDRVPETFERAKPALQALADAFAAIP